MPPKKKEKPVPEVSPAEWEVLESLWKHGSQAARDVYASLQTEKRWDIKTVRTLLSRWSKKGRLSTIKSEIRTSIGPLTAGIN